MDLTLIAYMYAQSEKQVDNILFYWENNKPETYKKCFELVNDGEDPRVAIAEIIYQEHKGKIGDD